MRNLYCVALFSYCALHGMFGTQCTRLLQQQLRNICSISGPSIQSGDSNRVIWQNYHGHALDGLEDAAENLEPIQNNAFHYWQHYQLRSRTTRMLALMAVAFNLSDRQLVLQQLPFLQQTLKDGGLKEPLDTKDLLTLSESFHRAERLGEPLTKQERGLVASLPEVAVAHTYLPQTFLGYQARTNGFLHEILMLLRQHKHYEFLHYISRLEESD